MNVAGSVRVSPLEPAAAGPAGFSSGHSRQRLMLAGAAHRLMSNSRGPKADILMHQAKFPVPKAFPGLLDPAKTSRDLD